MHVSQVHLVHLDSGKLFVWGDNQYSKLFCYEESADAVFPFPTEVMSSVSVQKVSLGVSTSACIDLASTVFVCGKGMGSVTQLDVCQKPDRVSDFHAGDGFFAFLTGRTGLPGKGDVMVKGRHKRGLLALDTGDNSSRYRPVKVALPSKAKRLFGSSSCLVAETGSIEVL